MKPARVEALGRVTGRRTPSAVLALAGFLWVVRASAAQDPPAPAPADRIEPASKPASKEEPAKAVVPRASDAKVGRLAPAQESPSQKPEGTETPQTPQPIGVKDPIAVGLSPRSAGAPAPDGNQGASRETGGASPVVVPLSEIAPALRDFSTLTEFIAFEAALTALEKSAPEWLKLESLGKSRGGRDLWLAIATDTRVGEAGKKPALFVFTDLAPSGPPEGASANAPAPRGERIDVGGPAAALAALDDLLDRARMDSSVQELLRRTVVYCLAAPDPDDAFAADAALGARASRLDRNFPFEWAPHVDGGPYPLSEPESQALASFLVAHPNIAATLILSRAELRPREATPDDDCRLSPRERGLCARIAELTGAPASGLAIGGARLRPADDFARDDGSLAASCEGLLGAFAFLATGPVDPLATSTSPDGAHPVRGGDLVLTLAQSLPRLVAGPPALDRLRADTWMVDLVLENRGLLPSLSEALRARMCASVWLEAAGARVVAAALRRTSASSFEPLRAPSGRLFLGHLDASESCTLRLVVQAAEGGVLELGFDSLRAGRERVSVPLN